MSHYYYFFKIKNDVTGVTQAVTIYRKKNKTKKTMTNKFPLILVLKNDANRPSNKKMGKVFPFLKKKFKMSVTIVLQTSRQKKYLLLLNKSK